MSVKNYSSLENVTTPEIQVQIIDKKVVFAGGTIYSDADDELLKIAEYIKMNNQHNENIIPERIKFLYTTVARKSGGRYKIGDLGLRSELEKMINDEFDYTITIYYKAWKELDIEHKVLQLDKTLCGIKIGDENKTKIESVDSKEYRSNMKCYGSDKVLESSEIVDMTIERIVEEEKEQKKNS